MEKTNTKAEGPGIDDKPDSAYIKAQAVADLLNISRTQVYRLSAAGVLPPPIKLSTRTNVFNVGALRSSLKRGGA